MKKTYYLLLFALMISAAAEAQTSWVTKKLDDRISVKFPVEPEKTTNRGIDVYNVKGKDSIGYSANVIDYKVIANLDSAALAPMKDSQMFVDQLVMGISSQKTNYTFGTAKIGKWKTFTTYDVSATEKTNKNSLFLHMILIGSKMYNFSCRLPAGLAIKNNEIYFASIEMLK